MRERSDVLVVSGEEGINLELGRILNEAGFDVRIVGSCAEARLTLKDPAAPVVLFSDTALPDGTWADVLSLATEQRSRVPVIVVSRVVDIDLYINALEMGASDFIVPPFYHQDILQVLKCATQRGVAIQALATA